MAPIPPSASVRLTYPIYSSDFDAHNNGFLFVGGGGGAGRSGVKNKIVRGFEARQQRSHTDFDCIDTD